MNYIELSSAFRNRKEYPNQAEFLTRININSSTDTVDSINSKEPISLAYPIYNFDCDKFITRTVAPQIEDLSVGYYPRQGITHVFGQLNSYGIGSSSKPHLDVSTPQPITPGSLANASSCDDYFDGCFLQHFASPVVSYPAIGDTSLILSYEGKTRECNLQNSISIGNPPFAFQVINVSHGNRVTAFIKILGGKDIQNHYIDCYLEDVTMYKSFNSFDQRFKYINSYEALERNAYLETPFPETSGTAIGWQLNDRYRIRKAIPCIMGYQTDLMTGEQWPYSAPAVLCNAGIGPSSHFSNGVYEVDIVNKGFGYTIGEVYSLAPLLTPGNQLYKYPVIKITGICPNGEITNLQVIFPGYDLYSVGSRFDINNSSGGGTGGSVIVIQTGQSIDLTPAANNNNGLIGGSLSSLQDAYKGQMAYIPILGPEYEARIRKCTPLDDPYVCYDPPYYQQLPAKLSKNEDGSFTNNPYSPQTTGSSPILKYIYMTKQESITVGFTQPQLQQNFAFIFVSCFKESYTGYTTNCTPILNVLYRKFLNKQDWEILPFSYTGEHELNYTGSSLSHQESSCYNLTLSHLILPNVTLQTGGLIAFYPEIFVEITNLGQSSNASNLIYSNNPNISRATFKLAIDNTSTPIRSKFIKLAKRRHTSTVLKFKPNDNIFVRVFFADGTTFTTAISDNAPPSIINPLLQLSILLEINRP